MLQHLQVLFVPNKYDDNVWASQRACVREPVGERVVRFAAIAKEKKKKRAKGGEFVWGKNQFCVLQTWKCRRQAERQLLHGNTSA